MKSTSYKKLLTVASLVICVFVGFTYAAEEDADENAIFEIETAQDAIKLASVSVAEARVAIEEGKLLLAKIPADSVFMSEVKEVLVVASQNWTTAVESFEWAEISASKMKTASSQAVSDNYELLGIINAYVSHSGANVVKTTLIFIEAVADDKGESLDIIRAAMQDAIAASAQVQFYYERAKFFILEADEEMAEASGILSEISALVVHTKMNLAKRALLGDVDLLSEAMKRSDGLDATFAGAQREYIEFEKFCEEGRASEKE